MHATRTFGRAKTGQPASLHRYTDTDGCGFALTDYGAALVSLVVPDQAGRPVDVLLGFDDVSGYEGHNGCAGAVCGRVVNRIRHGVFTLSGTTYRLAINDAAHHLHGGLTGFDKRFWRVTPLPDGYLAALESAHMEEGYPGRLAITVAYRWLAPKGLAITYRATADRETVCSLSNHAYFNLNGPGGASLEQTLRLFADVYTPHAPDGVPSGELRPVHGPYDIRQATRLSDLVASTDEDVRAWQGIDHNFVIPDFHANNPALRRAAVLHGPATGISMTVFTTSPGIHVYTGNFIDNWHGKNGRIYNQHDGIALETQYYPNAVNEPAFPSPVLKAGARQVHTTIFSFASEADLETQPLVEQQFV